MTIVYPEGVGGPHPTGAKAPMRVVRIAGVSPQFRNPATVMVFVDLSRQADCYDEMADRGPELGVMDGSDRPVLTDVDPAVIRGRLAEVEEALRLISMRSDEFRVKARSALELAVAAATAFNSDLEDEREGQSA